MTARGLRAARQFFCAQNSCWFMILVIATTAESVYTGENVLLAPGIDAGSHRVAVLPVRLL